VPGPQHLTPCWAVGGSKMDPVRQHPRRGRGSPVGACRPSGALSVCGPFGYHGPDGIVHESAFSQLLSPNFASLVGFRVILTHPAVGRFQDWSRRLVTIIVPATVVGHHFGCGDRVRVTLADWQASSSGDLVSRNRALDLFYRKRHFGRRCSMEFAI